ncbi:MAG: polyprenyl diphosphate synthase [Promethearchaeia archaeon]
MNLEELAKNKENLPKHIGLILDGNRRWARERGLDINMGHFEGYKTITNILKSFFKAGIRYLSIYALSLENYRKRSKNELEYIYKMIKMAVKRVKEEPIIKEEKIKFDVIGRWYLLPKDVQEKIKEVKEYTKDHHNAFINLCLMYDGQAEIVDAVKHIVQEGVDPQTIDKKVIKKYLYTKKFPELDYIIRTGMEDGSRISGFLLWDASYAEFKFRNEYWPEYNEQMLIEDLNDYLERHRRRGK